MSTDTADKGRLLTRMARASIAKRFGAAMPALPHPAWLDEPGAAFVTLTEHGQLRGCIGSLEAHRTLGSDIEANAQAAAFRDPRFPPLGPEELADIDLEISVLTPMREIDSV